MENLAEVLRHYGIVGEVRAVHEGPLVKQIEFLPAAGTKLKTISASLPDIARELGVSSLRVEPVDGAATLGFEVSADDFKTIDFAALLSGPDFQNAKGAAAAVSGGGYYRPAGDCRFGQNAAFADWRKRRVQGNVRRAEHLYLVADCQKAAVHAQTGFD